MIANLNMNLKKMSIDENTLPHAIIYCRVSSKKQLTTTENNGNYSIDMQEQLCSAYAKQKYKIIDVVKEVASGKDMKNQKKLLSIVRENKDIVILILNVSRFSRDLFGYLNLCNTIENNGIKIIFVQEEINTATSNGKHLLRCSISDSQKEIEILSERIKRSVAYRRENNIPMGRIPYGYKRVFNTELNKHELKDNEEEILISSIIWVLYNKYVYNFDNGVVLSLLIKYKNSFTLPNFKDVPLLEGISNYLNENNILKRKRKWSENMIRYLIKNLDYEKIILYLKDNEIYIPENKIVEEEVEEEVKEEVKEEEEVEEEEVETLTSENTITNDSTYIEESLDSEEITDESLDSEEITDEYENNSDIQKKKRRINDEEDEVVEQDKVEVVEEEKIIKENKEVKKSKDDFDMNMEDILDYTFI